MKQITKCQWLEIIKIQSSSDAGNKIKTTVSALNLDAGQMAGRHWQVYSNALGDIAIHIYWDSSFIPLKGSHIGLQLADALSDWGIINHTIWKKEA